MDVLIEATTQPDERVRLAVTDNLGNFHADRAADALLKVAREDTNPDVAAAALRALGGYDRPDVRELLFTRLRTPSFRNVLADAAVAGLRRMDDPAFVSAIQGVLAQTKPAFTTEGFGAALEALAFLARHDTNPTPVRVFIADQIQDPRPKLQLAALRALGILKDERALPLLETFASAGPEDPRQAEARQAIDALRDSRPPAEEVTRLRNEVTDLRDANRDLKRQVEDLRKRFDALQPAHAEPKGSSKTRKPVPR
jgi:HEAT repeat protein